MIESIRKIQPLNQPNKSTKIGSVLALNSRFIAYIVDSKLIELLEYDRRDKKSIILSGHNEEIICMKFSNQFASDITEKLVLCSCSIDWIIIWDVTEMTFSNEKTWKVLKKDLDFGPSFCSFHPNNKTIAVCYGETLTIFDINVRVIRTSILNIKRF
jgi:WD40 repeat protein